MFQMNEVQLFVIGLIGSGLVIGLRQLAVRFQWKPTKTQLTWGVFGVSMVMAYAWLAPQLAPIAFPQWPDFSGTPGESVILFLNFIGACLGVIVGWFDGFTSVAVTIVGAATLIYNFLLEKISKDGTTAVRRMIASIRKH